MEKEITISITINAPVEKVWKYFTEPEHIIKWNNASLDWHTTKAENDVRVGGSFNSRMEAKDGSSGFDFSGTYTDVMPFTHIAYTIEDGRKVSIDFTEEGGQTHITETFEAEHENSVEMQKTGWQAILNNFKQYIEAN
jgi:uncharacterized protein YndB with AHSA1/START domain